MTKNTSKDINQEYGFYGTMKNRFDNPEDVKTIHQTAFNRIKQIYPELKDEAITEMLNGRAGRHFADELLDMPGEISMTLVLMRIALLSRLSLRKWMYFNDGLAEVLPPVDMKQVYITAIKLKMMEKTSIDRLVRKELGCAFDSIWPSAELWLNAENVPLKELETMWQLIQRELGPRC